MATAVLQTTVLPRTTASPGSTPSASPVSSRGSEIDPLDNHVLPASHPPPRAQLRTDPIKVIVVSDMNCPWCYVAFKSINNSLSHLALALLPNLPPNFEVEYRPYPLVTTLGGDDVAIERLAHMQKKFGKDRSLQMMGTVAARGKELGIDFKFGGLMRHSTRAHRLLYLAYKRGGMALQQALLTHLFRALWEQEEDIGSPPVLATYAHMVGLMGKDEAEEWVRGTEYEDEVTKLAAVSAGCGIRGVPFVVVDGKWAISGAQADGVYYQVFEKLARGEPMN